MVEGEIRVSEAFLVGRMVRGPVETPDGKLHYLLDAGTGEPLHLVAVGKEAATLKTYIKIGDELSVEGFLEWVNFPNTGNTLIINVRYVSYGRKARSNREVTSLR